MSIDYTCKSGASRPRSAHHRWISRCRSTTRRSSGFFPIAIRSCSSIASPSSMPDKRIVGIKNVTLNERYLAHRRRRAAGAAADDSHRGDRAGRRDPDPRQAGEPREAALLRAASSGCATARPVHPGDVVEIEAIVRRLRSRMGVLKGIARVDGKVVVEGTMTFALGPRTGVPDSGSRPATRSLHAVDASANHEQHRTDLHRARRPHRPLRVRVQIAPRVEDRGRQHQRADPRFVDSRAATPCRACRAQPVRVRANAATGVRNRGADVEREQSLREAARVRRAAADAGSATIHSSRAAPRIRPTKW